MSNNMRAGIFWVLAITVLFLQTACGGGSGPVAPADPNPPTPDVWKTPVHHYAPEVFPSDYIVGKEYQFTLMRHVSDAVNAGPNEFVVGLYTDSGVLFPYDANLTMVSVGDLYVNEKGKFTALDPGQQTLKVEVRDVDNHLYATILFGPYFENGLLWDSPVGRFNIEAKPDKFLVGRIYDMELIHNMGDLVYWDQNREIMIGLYRKDDEGALFSPSLDLKFVPSGDSIFINEFGEFTADSTGVKTVIAQVVDSVGHLYITVVFHMEFIQPGENPPPPPLQSCRDEHPAREAIDGYWWDCVGGDWQNTGVSVNLPPPPPPPDDPSFIGRWYEGANPYDVSSDGAVITIEFGTEIPLQWFWRFGDMTTEDINSSEVTFDDNGLVTPFWVWVGDGLLHALTENTNGSYTYLDYGDWDLNFSSPSTYGSAITYSVTLRVVEQHTGQ